MVDEKPEFCNGQLCLELVNRRRNPIVRLTINGEPVRMVGRRPFIFPRGSAFIRFVRPGTYRIEGWLADTVAAPRGAIVTGTIVESCLVNATVGTMGDAARGGAHAELSGMECASEAARTKQ